MPVSSRAPTHLYEAISRVAGLGADKLETARRRWNEWQHEGYSSGGGDGRRSKNDIPDVGSTLLRMEFDRVEVAHEAEDLMRRSTASLLRLAQLVEMANRTDPGDVLDKNTLRPGQGSCVACGRWCDGDRKDRLVQGLCPAHYEGMRRARHEGQDRHAYISHVRRGIETRTGDRVPPE